MDLSSDTEASFLDASPPHRFSDSDFEPIEAMSITLDTALNFNTLDQNVSTNDTPSRLQTSSAPPKMEIQSSAGEQDRDEFLSRNSSLTTMFGFDNNFSSQSKIPVFPQRRSLYDSSSKRRWWTNNRGNSQSLPRPFRRHISLPASMFYRVLDKSHISGSGLEANPLHEEDVNGSGRLFRTDSILVSTKNNSISTAASPNVISGVAGRFFAKNRRKMSTQDSAESSTGSGSLANASDDEETASGNDWMVDESNHSFQSDGDEMEGATAFTSELEKRSLLLRHVRKLVRQETTGNFAPPDYCI